VQFTASLERFIIYPKGVNYVLPGPRNTPPWNSGNTSLFRIVSNYYLNSTLEGEWRIFCDLRKSKNAFK
jgi:hypothetical protein